jgi:hypothetical protein
MSKKKSSQFSVRPVIKQNFSQIERIYAHLGMVHVEGKDGKLSTMTPKEAAIRAMAINEGMPDEPSSAKVAQALIDQIIQVCREAKRQQEAPGNKETDLVAKAVNKSEADYKRSVRPDLKLLFDKYVIEFPMLSPEEIRVVLEQPEGTENYKHGLLHAYNTDRTATWIKEGKLTAPIL